MNTKIKDLYMYVLGAIVVLTAFALGIMLVLKEIPVSNKDIVVVAVTALITMAVNVVGYFFGSSKSSADKSDRIDSFVQGNDRQKTDAQK